MIQSSSLATLTNERSVSILPGRCLVALGTDGADGPLSEARELFAAMGYAPALDETDTLLQRATAPTS